MAKLYFRYGSMNCGKTTSLLQVDFNYKERGMNTFLIKPKIDTKGADEVISRIGISKKVDYLTENTDDLYKFLTKIIWENNISCVLVDEANFLNPKQIDELYEVAVKLNTPVICFGLRTDFMNKGFPASSRLLELAHEITELKNVCRCGKKSTLNMRLFNGKPVFKGEQIAIDGENKVEYISVCSSCFFRYKEEYEETEKNSNVV